jgi:predicted membrane-bound spermidine synthase
LNFDLIHIILTIAFLHWVADFVLQTSWMSQNKSTSIKALGAHIATYFAAITIGLFIVSTFLDVENILQFTVLNALLHFVTDFFSSKGSSYFYKRNQLQRFFIVVGFDQFIHLATFLLTLEILV